MNKICFVDKRKSLAEIKEAVNGSGFFILVDKDQDWTSFDVVRKVKNIFKIKKVGHSGTLDPLATGLLILALGKATKQINDLILSDKEYLTTFKLGYKSNTYDLKGEIQKITDEPDLAREDIEFALANYRGKILQTPPMFSALKYKGKKLYDYAREGKEIVREKRAIEIYSNQIISYQKPNLELKIHCSKGTYIRSIANDLGEDLKVGALVSSLRRTKIGSYQLEDAFKIKELLDLKEKLLEANLV